MVELPSGTVTFVFTDVEGSTKLLHELGAQAYAEALAEHRRVIRDACAAQGGVEVDTQGDAFFFAFPTAAGAVDAALAFTEGLASGPIQVRVGLHTGTPMVTDEGYIGDDVHFGARVASSSHGGQVVLSRATAELVELELTDLGEHRLKDIPHAVPIYQLGDGAFPPLKTISNTNLPRPASSFVGRERETQDVVSLLRDGARLVTLSGPGGTGKTRLSIEAASELVPEFKAGVFWVGLATLRNPALVTETISQTLGAKNGLAEHIGERELLLLLDNLEQVIEAAPDLADLLEACPNLRLLVTSRELLRVRGEVDYAVPPLAEPEAVTLFCARSQLEADETIAELCRRLDDLPLAVELAAARTSVLSPYQILERLSQRLDLLKGGRDSEARQQTLRATIEWSYELLSPDEQQLFARLAVFAGGCTLEMAEEVAEAHLDTLQSLVDKSLLRFTDKRYWMLETIREYATERLEASAEIHAVRRAHAESFVALARSASAGFRSAPREWGDRLEDERDNLRTALTACLATGRYDLAHELAIAYGFLTSARGPLTEGRSWFRAVLEQRIGVPDPLRQRALRDAASLAERQRDHNDARILAEESLQIARALGDPGATAEALLMLGVVEGSSSDFARAESLEREALAVFRAIGDDRRVRATLGLLAWVAMAQGSHEAAQDLCEEALQLSREAGDDRGVVLALGNLGAALSEQGKFEEALPFHGEALSASYDQRDLGGVADGLVEIAAAAFKLHRYEVAGAMLGASDRLREETESSADLLTEDQQHETLEALRVEIGSDALASAIERGRGMQLDETVAEAIEFIDSNV